MHALVTGGAGLIGSHIVDRLLDDGHRVRIYDNLEPETHGSVRPPWIPEAAEFILGDMADRDALHKALDGIDIIFHQAAYGGFSPVVSKYVQSNSLGTAYLFELIKLHGLPVQKIVVASSQAVYGEGQYRCPTHGTLHPKVRPTEQLKRRAWEARCPECASELLPMPTSEGIGVDPGLIYSVTKYSEERIALILGRSLGIPTVALRYSLTYGPRQSLRNPYTGICSIFSSRILNGLPVVIYEDGRQTRDFVFVDDVARANLFVMASERADYRVFNVGTGTPTTVQEFAGLLADAYGVPVNLEMEGCFRPGEVRHLFSDGSALADIGFVPTTTLREGVHKYARWIRTQGDIREYFSAAFQELRDTGVVLHAD